MTTPVDGSSGSGPAGGGGGSWQGGNPGTGADGQIIITFTYPVITPGTLSTTGNTSTTVSLSITSSSGGDSGPYTYQLQRAPDVSGSAGSYSNNGSSQSGTTWIDTGLSSSTKYWYRVVISDNDSDTVNSNEISVITSISGTIGKNRLGLMMVII